MHHVHQTDQRIEEHFTDTAGATDQVFGVCRLLGFQFSPRIKDLKDRKLYTIEKPARNCAIRNTFQRDCNIARRPACNAP
jgi:TnpA family transposase